MKLEYKNNKRPFKPSLPNVLKPSKLLLPTDFTETCLLQLFGTHNTLDCIRQASPASFGKSPKLPKLQNTLYILNRCVLCLGTNLLSMGITMGEGRRRDYKDFSLRMSSSLSNKVGVLQKPLLGFFSQQPSYAFHRYNDIYSRVCEEYEKSFFYKIGPSGDSFSRLERVVR